MLIKINCLVEYTNKLLINKILNCQHQLIASFYAQKKLLNKKKLPDSGNFFLTDWGLSKFYPPRFEEFLILVVWLVQVPHLPLLIFAGHIPYP